jgi:hypothetical protein
MKTVNHGIHGAHGNRNFVTSSRSPNGREVSQFCAIDGIDMGQYFIGTSLLFVSTAGHEAGFCESAFAYLEKESAEWPFGPQSGQESPTLGANRSTPKKKRPAFPGRRSGDAIPGGLQVGR